MFSLIFGVSLDVWQPRYRHAIYARIDEEFATRGWTSLADTLSGSGAGIRGLTRELATTAPSLHA
jgi:hypothetical protein